MFTLTPKEDKFYDYFISYADIIYKSAEKLKSFANDLSNSDAKFQEIKNLERDGDKMLHEIIKQLNLSFITPIDREDIFMIGKELDDIIDLIETTASRFVMLDIHEATHALKDMCGMIVSSAGEIITLMKEFKQAKKSKKLSGVIIDINKIEEDADLAFRKAFKDLFTGGLPALDVIKWKEIYEYLEKTINACEDLANTIEGVVMKHA